jgi:2-pyrone-4,6-dicarboxylate lactonase
MDKNWISFHPDPSRPMFRLPAGAVDAHCHVFGPADVFPYAAARKYTPADAPKEKLWALRAHLGFSRSVIVQATCHGTDNAAMLDAIAASGGTARGIATVRRDVSDAELQRLHAAGVRGLRFNFIKRLVDVLPSDELMELASRIAPMGWHVIIYCEGRELKSLSEFIARLPVTVAFDHMARPDVTLGVEGEDFQFFLRMLEEHQNFWCKVSCPERLSAEGPPDYADVMPFARTIVERFPERVMTGSDWPHPNMTTHSPDDGKLVDFISKIAVTEALQNSLLIENPMRLYWPEELTA